MRLLLSLAIFLYGCGAPRVESNDGLRQIQISRTAGLGGANAQILVSRINGGFFVTCDKIDTNASQITARLYGVDYNSICELFGLMSGEWSSRGNLTVGRLMIDGTYLTIKAAGTEVTVCLMDEIPDYLESDEKQLLSVINRVGYDANHVGLGLW